MGKPKLQHLRSLISQNITLISKAQSNTQTLVSQPPTKGLCKERPVSLIASRFVSSSKEKDVMKQFGESEREMMRTVASVLHDDKHTFYPSSKDPNSGKTYYVAQSSMTQQRKKDKVHKRKEMLVFRKNEDKLFKRLITSCEKKVGSEATLQICRRMGRVSGGKEYNTLMEICLENAKISVDKAESREHIEEAFRLLKIMKEEGYSVDEEAYGPFLMYFIDSGMEIDFFSFMKYINDKSSSKVSRLAYYEMLFWIRVDNMDKVHDLCSSLKAGTDYEIAASYLIVLCENDKKNEILLLLNVVDITKDVSLASCVFKFLGRLLLEDIAEKIILAVNEDGADKASLFICHYVTNIPNLAVDDVALKFRDWHNKFDVVPSSTSYKKLLAHHCDLHQVHEALDVLDQMCSSGVSPSVECLNNILHVVEESSQIELVRPIYSMIHLWKLKTDIETYRIMIKLFVMMKDFKASFKMLAEPKEMNLGDATSGMYNTIMGGYFREKNIPAALIVFNHMKKENIKPDNQTFSYIISNCETEEDIVKYYELMQTEGVEVTKHIYMALVNAYVNCGNVEKARKVLVDNKQTDNMEIKSILVLALAANGHISVALEIYDEIKQAGHSLEPKRIINLIEHVQSELELDRLLWLLKELKDTEFWSDGCRRIVVFCARYKLLRSAIDLLKQLNEKDTKSIEVVLDQVFSEVFDTEPSALEFGLDLLKAVKEELSIRPSRTILDFLLSACVSAKDSHHARLIWKEYEIAYLPFNVLTYLRMYQVLLASGEQKGAESILKKISFDDPDVRYIVKASQRTFGNFESEITQKKRLNICKHRRKASSVN